MKSVSYTTRARLDGELNSDVVLCVSSALMADGTAFADARIAFAESATTNCGRIQYRYAFVYDESILDDPDRVLEEADITGVFCRSCLTDYIDSKAGVLVPVAKGPAGSRPVPLAAEIGRMYFDTTLDADGLPIWWNGTKWIKADGSDA